MAIFALLCVSSCSDDGKGKGDSLVGRWQNYAFIYCLNSGGKGYFQYAPTNGAYDVVGDEKSYFRWSATDELLTLSFDGSGTTGVHTSTYFYDLSGDMLVMIDIETGQSSTYMRQ